MLKALREDGFAVTLYERRHRVGGLWAYSDNPTHTTALPVTRANLSKFTCGFSDYPIPDKYPTYMQPHHFQQYMEEYAKHFDLLRDIVLGADVKLARRSDDDTRWLLDVEQEAKTETVEYDRIVFCHGYQSKADMPTFEGQEKFEGVIMHSQAYRDPAQFRGKNVIVVGLSSTSGDIIPTLMPVANKVYISHRRGAFPFTRYRNGTPNDLVLNWRRRQIGNFFQRYFPRFSRWLADTSLPFLARRSFDFDFDPSWNLEPFPSITLNLPGSFELIFPYLRDGSLTSLRGLTRFTGPRSLELADDTALTDIDAVLLCTGYSADWSALAPFVSTSQPPVKSYTGPPLYRLYRNIFPPEYATTCALLCYSAFGKNNGFSFADVTAWAVSNVFRGVEPLPSRAEMESSIDTHQRWIAEECYAREPYCDTSMVRQWEFQAWLHKAAGTGMENLGWGWKGWKFWWNDREMYGLMNHGVETAHAFRYFETGKRRTWEGAREAIVHVNRIVGEKFPCPEEEGWWKGKRE
ncbi:flavin monooxygenase-like protein [Immersiella caudata]|uniref:Flavin monooxygenase-like protein n=1 Tax=Immersiella caudata TaxID=314043 RepID=A0AA39WJW4_9PEZI|nr:flavin monooxygenase-like protein [Immersiella caudata]